MKTFAILAATALSLTVALSASADERGRGGHNSKPIIDLGASIGGKHSPLASVDATVKGVIDVDADILSKNRKGASILDLNATVGKLGLGVDLEGSKKKGLDLDVNVGKSRGGRNNYDFGGGVGH